MTSTAFDLDLIFPIRDVASADLMMLKATCLWNAGIIDDRQRKLVQQRAAGFSAGKRNRLWKFPDCRNAYPQGVFVLRRVVLAGGGIERLKTPIIEDEQTVHNAAARSCGPRQEWFTACAKTASDEVDICILGHSYPEL